MLPVEVGDAELRADLEQVRALLDGLGARAASSSARSGASAGATRRGRRWR